MKEARTLASGKMNKDNDIKVVPSGEYRDALNLRVNSNIDGNKYEGENVLGNSLLAQAEYKGIPLSSSARTVGSVATEEDNTIYWIITDGDNSVSVTGKLDLIISYQTTTGIMKYIIISENDGGGVNTTLNLNENYLIGNSIVYIDGLLIFTDSYGDVKCINTERNYPYPDTSTGVDGFNEQSILLIKAPPTSAPTIELSSNDNDNDYIKDKFITYSYRYKYKDGAYSATSPYSEVAFSPDVFSVDGSNVLNQGMINKYNNVNLTFNSGGEEVESIEIISKESNNNIIKVIERLDKDELSYLNNTEYNIDVDSNKTISIINNTELLRLYDDVPLTAKALTFVSNMIILGNYTKGYDLIDNNGNPINLDYSLEHISSFIDINDISEDCNITDESYGIEGGTPVLMQDSGLDIDMSGQDLIKGAKMSISITYEHSTFSVDNTTAPATPSYLNVINFEIILDNNYSNVYDLANSQEFINAIGGANIKPIAYACDGYTFTDIMNCSTEDSYGTFDKYGSGISAVNEPIKISSSVGNDTIGLQLLATLYKDSPTSNKSIYEYYKINDFSVSYSATSNTKSLHSHTDYEVCMIYKDGYGRASSPVLSNQNVLFIPSEYSGKKNSINVIIPTTQKPPYWADRYTFGLRQSKESYNTIIALDQVTDSDSDSVYFLVEGENAQKVEKGDKLIVKSDGAGIKSEYIELEVLSKDVQEEDFTGATSPAGTYIELNGSQLSDIDNYTRYDYGSFNNFSYSEMNKTQIYRYEIDINQAINVGDSINISFSYSNKTLDRINQKIYQYEFNKTFIASKSYSNISDWFHEIYIDMSSGEETTENGITSSANIKKNFNTSNISFSKYSTSELHQDENWYYFEYNTTNGKYYFVMEFGLKDIDYFNSTSAACNANFKITRNNNLPIFETKRENTIENVYYESSKSYNIVDGFHQGDINQTDTVAGEVELDFFNCFVFGNGAESYRYKDSITGNTFNLGERTYTLEDKKYKEESHNAVINYSGLYSDESNVNNLNVFNKGLLNFKLLKKEHGEIMLLDDIGEDIFVIQSNKISKVLVNKNIITELSENNLLSAAPDMLGNQIFNMYDYGTINPESYVKHGIMRYFADEKRGVLLSISGDNVVSGLDIISAYGMEGYFKEKMEEYAGKYKIGGYDIKNEEYILTFTDFDIPTENISIKCGTEFKIKVENELTFYIDYGTNIGTVTTELNNEDSAEYEVTVDYNGTETTEAIVGEGEIEFDKTLQSINKAKFTIVTEDEIVITIKSNCPVQEEINIFLICLSSNEDFNKLIHNEYKYTTTSFDSSVNSEALTLWKSNDDYVISMFQEVVSQQGNNNSPTNGANVTIRTNKQRQDTFDISTVSNKFRYLRTDTLYSNNITSINSLISVSTALTPIADASSRGIHYNSFTMPSSGENLYMIWDYRKPTNIDLCYDSTSYNNVCCDCKQYGSYYMDTSQFSTATTLYNDEELTVTAAQGYYSDGTIYRYLDSEGALGAATICPTCVPSCPLSLYDDRNGYYELSTNMGSATGAIVIKILINNISLGLLFELDSTYYNDIISTAHGLLTITNNDDIHYLDSSNSCIDTSLEYAADNYEYSNEFYPVGTQESVSVTTSQLSSNTSYQDKCYMIIPYTNTSSPVLDMIAVMLCDNSWFDIDILCPSSLPYMAISESGSTVEEVENYLLNGDSYYYTPNDDGVTIDLYSSLFTDSGAVNKLSNGFYKVSSNNWIYIEDGVVTNKGEF